MLHHARHPVARRDAVLLGHRVVPADLTWHAFGAALARGGAAAFDGLEGPRPAHELPLPIRAEGRPVLDEGLAFEAHAELVAAHEGPHTVGMAVSGVALELVVVGEDVFLRLAARDFHGLGPRARAVADRVGVPRLSFDRYAELLVRLRALHGSRDLGLCLRQRRPGHRGPKKDGR